MNRAFLVAMVASGLSFVGAACGGAAHRQEWVDRLKPRAAFELSCPQEHLSFTALGEWTEGVEGCGKKATYVMGQTDWVLNSVNGQPAGLPSTPAAAK